MTEAFVAGRFWLTGFGIILRLLSTAGVADTYSILLLQLANFKNGCSEKAHLHRCMKMESENCQPTADAVVEECFETKNTGSRPVGTASNLGTASNACMLHCFALAGYARSAYMGRTMVLINARIDNQKREGDGAVPITAADAVSLLPILPVAERLEFCKPDGFNREADACLSLIL